MRRLLLGLGAVLALQACRLNPECFRGDECDPGFRCIGGSCLASQDDAGQDAGPDDRGSPDTDPSDVDPSDLNPDGSAADAGSPHGQPGCRGPGIVGNPLPNLRSGLEFGQNDYLLFHFDEPDPATNSSGSLSASVTCNGACSTIDCQVYDGALSAGSRISVNYNALNPLDFPVGQFRFEAWFRWNGQAGCILSAQDSGQSPLSWSVCVNDNGVVSPAPNNEPSATVQLVMGSWTHIGALFTDFEAFVQLDGVLAGSYPNTASAPGTGVQFLRIDSAAGALDEVRFGETNTDDYLTSKDYPRVCIAYQGANSQLFVADEHAKQPRQLNGVGRMPRLSPDLERVIFVECNLTCDIMEEVVSTGVLSSLMTDVDSTLAPAYGPSGQLFYVPSVNTQELRGMSSSAMALATHNAQADIDAFDVTAAQSAGGGQRLPIALIATSSSARPQIEIIEYDGVSVIQFPGPIWRGEPGERVTWLRFLGVDPVDPLLGDDGSYQGFWVAHVSGGGSDRLVYGNRNACIVDPAQCGSSAAFSSEPMLHPIGTQSLGFSDSGALLLQGGALIPISLNPTLGGRGQLDLQWSL